MLDFLSRFTSQPPKDPPVDDIVALVEAVARFLAEKPDDVRVEVVAGETMTAVELRVAKEDLGRIIGRKGRMAGAMRTILAAAGTRSGKKYVLEIVE